jgi:hypothetical protein
MTNTLALAKTLKATGLTETQAEALAFAIIEENPQYITKEYLKEQFASLENRILLKLGSLMVILFGLAKWNPFQ